MNCAICDSRTMSWAPRLISLSSSGKRYDSVSRESSVHSMMSMNCLPRKSRIALALLSLLPGGELLFLDLGARRFLPDLLQRQGARDHGPVGQDRRRRRV